MFMMSAKRNLSPPMEPISVAGTSDARADLSTSFKLCGDREIMMRDWDSPNKDHCHSCVCGFDA